MPSEDQQNTALTALAEVVFWSLCFLETAAEQVLDDEAACAQLEDLLFLLGRGGPQAREAVCLVADNVANVDGRGDVRDFAGSLRTAWEEANETSPPDSPTRR